MKLFIFRLFLLITVLSSGSLIAAANGFFGKGSGKSQDTTTFVPPYAEDNQRCFKCHGQAMYEYTNEKLGRKIKAMMFSERIIDKDEFYKSNHRNFSCTDCHSTEYANWPHSGELRMEQKLICLDCHGGDEKFAQYHFEEIEADYKQSVHFKMEEDGFTCWKCHNPHSYKISERNLKNVKETVAYDNAICLNCHANFDRFKLLTDRLEIDIIKKHEWLPNQAAHFANVRCIECHTKINNNVPVSHQIMPKDQAVRRCNECHSQNSILMASLYKFEAKQDRRDGFLNGVILKESYVIGANRNKYLNILSLIIFAGVIGVVGFHTLLRLRKK